MNMVLSMMQAVMKNSKKGLITNWNGNFRTDHIHFPVYSAKVRNTDFNKDKEFFRVLFSYSLGHLQRCPVDQQLHSYYRPTGI